MKKRGASWVFLLVFALAGWALAGQEKEQSPPPQTQKRPTLGPAPAPSLSGPKTSTTLDARKLRRIRSLFVERIDNSLSDKLAEEIVKMGRFKIVASRNEADAILRGSCFDSHRLRSVHSEVFITDRSGAPVWQDSIRRPFNPPALDKVVDETALLVADHLGRSLRDADRN